MYDFSKQLKEFHDLHVVLSQEQQTEMRQRRNINRSRIANAADERFSILDSGSFVIQGSYAMHTMIQDENNDYDIDDGVKIHKDLLVDEYGYPYTQMVAKSIILNVFKDDKRFAIAPVIKKNCVRIDYNEGYHIDIPVYRYYNDAEGNEKLELASDIWEITDPKGVTKWFNSAVTEKSPNDDKDQMRKVVRLLKMLVKKNQTQGKKLPCGFAISKLVDEVYDNADKSSLHSAFLETCELVKYRLKTNLIVEHPVISNNMIIGFNKIDETINLVDLLEQSLNLFNENINKLDPDTHYENIAKSWGVLFKSEKEINKIMEKYYNKLGIVAAFSSKDDKRSLINEAQSFDSAFRNKSIGINKTTNTLMSVAPGAGSTTKFYGDV